MIFKPAIDTTELLGLSEKELLLKFGYQPHHIVELPDGSAILDYEKVRKDWLVHLKEKAAETLVS